MLSPNEHKRLSHVIQIKLVELVTESLFLLRGQEWSRQLEGGRGGPRVGGAQTDAQLRRLPPVLVPGYKDAETCLGIWKQLCLKLLSCSGLLQVTMTHFLTGVHVIFK